MPARFRRSNSAAVEGILQQRRHLLTGILNGIDVDVWNPAEDPFSRRISPAKTSAPNSSANATCRRFSISRATLHDDVSPSSRHQPPGNQKGFDLMTEIMPQILRTGAQLVVLGTGQPSITLFPRVGGQFPAQVGLELGFNEGLAHQIEAGGDIFLMPSQFEPCGLNQMYSLRYGTVPVVRRTGGLADSIINTTPATLKSGAAPASCSPNTNRPPSSAPRAKPSPSMKPAATPAPPDGCRHGAGFQLDRSAREYEKILLNMLGGTPAVR